MERRLVECLACGQQRVERGEPAACPRCRYLGWAEVADVDEVLRRRLRDVPVPARRLVAFKGNVTSLQRRRRARTPTV
jgi:hypothetical protein